MINEDKEKGNAEIPPETSEFIRKICKLAEMTKEMKININVGLIIK